MKPDVRDRLVLPLLVPLGLLAIVAITAVLFGMILFFNPIEVSLTIATVVAAGILAAFGIANARREELTRAKRMVIVFAGVLPLLVGGLVAVGAIPLAEGVVRVADRECHFCIPEDAVEVVAEGVEFEQDEITLPADDEEVAILFINNDQNIPHNVYIYPIHQEEPLLDEPIFEGETFNGVDQRVYQFPPPDPGTYYFNCSVHPQQMTGTVVFE
ncbi:MAG: cupredoxin domain-containing protein [Actinomycetota bacterium]|nr:cupredoxin domain-containing protein [Actinomycetota bacterium]